jgi:ABC-2 type transport system ATP-binding protein
MDRPREEPPTSPVPPPGAAPPPPPAPSAEAGAPARIPTEPTPSVAPAPTSPPPPASDPVIVARGVRRVFAEGQGLRSLDLEVPSGVIFGIVGPSGSGKSTAVRLLLGAEQPTEGELSVFGRHPSEFTRDDRRRIGFLPQTSVLYPDLSLRHNLDLAASMYGVPGRSRLLAFGKRRREARRRISDILDFLDLGDAQRTRLGDASGGEQRRLGLAAALVHDPELLVLDEPTTGVDPVLRRRIWDRLRTLRDGGTTVFVTTQYLDEANHCDEVALLTDGRVVHCASPQALRDEAFGPHPEDEDLTFDDVFVELVRRHRRRERQQEVARG